MSASSRRTAGDDAEGATPVEVPESLEAPRFAPTRRVLDNGLVLLHQHNPASPAVYMSLHVAGGAALEGDELAGLAHFTGRMLTRGTERRTKAEVGEVLDFTGGGLSGRATRHVGAVGAKCRAADFDEILDLLGEVVTQPSFPADEVEKYRGDLLSSIREDADDPAQVALDRLRAAVYSGGHPYGRRVTGTEESAQRIAREDLVGYWRRHYRPEAAVLAVVGNVELEAALGATERALGGWASARSGDAAAPRTGLAAHLPAIPEPPPLEGIERVVEEMPDKSQTDVALGHAGVARRHPDFYAASVMNTVLGRFAMGGRLGRSVREEQGMAYYTYSALQAGVGAGPFLVRAGVDPRNVDRAIDSIVAEIRRIREEPVDRQELEDAKSSIIRSLPRLLESNEGMAGVLHQIEQYELGWDYLDRYPELIDAVDVDTVQRVARELLRPDAYRVAIAGPVAGEGEEGR